MKNLQKNEPNKSVNLCTHHCKDCHFYKNGMCLNRNPKVEHRIFGFPFNYQENKIKCKSWKERDFEQDFNWSHMN